MEFKHDWKIKRILNYFQVSVRSTNDYDFDERDYLLGSCGRAIELNCQTDGFVMPIDMFCEWVNAGTITPYDGTGHYLDYEGNKVEGYIFDEFYCPENAEFVAWYNK